MNLNGGKHANTELPKRVELSIILENFYMALVFALVNAIVVIFIFTFYTSIARDASFRRSFFEMALLSLGIASFTFGLGFAVRQFFNIEV